MVLVRYGNENTHRFFGKMIYYEDTVWGSEPEANFRKRQLENGGHYAQKTEQVRKDKTNYVVWSSQSLRHGTRSAKKRAARAERKKDENAKEK